MRARRINVLRNLLIVCMGVAGIFGLAGALHGGSRLAAADASAPVSQCSGTGLTGAVTITCHVTITNDFVYNAADPSAPTPVGPGATIVTSVECTGSAACAPGGTTTSTSPVTAITQCNNAGSGGASTVTCIATIVNDLEGYPDGAAITPTVLQCQSPGAVDTKTCTGSNRSGSGGPGGQSVNQCNGSGGAGGTLTCTVTVPDSQDTGLPATINQCNTSGKTGASTVTCTATITNNFTDSTTSPTSSTTVSAATTTTTKSTTPTTKPKSKPKRTTPTTTATPTTVQASSTTVAAGSTGTGNNGGGGSSGGGGGGGATTGGGGAGATTTGGGGGGGATTTGEGGGGATTTGPKTLATTGTNVAIPLTVGVTAIFFGGLLVLGSRRRRVR